MPHDSMYIVSQTSRAARIARNHPGRAARAGESVSAGRMLTLQRQVGNAATSRMLAGASFSGNSAWDIDPGGLLDNQQVSPAFAAVARAGLAAASANGLCPRVHEAFRSPSTSNKRSAAYKKGGPRAAPGWSSCHNYGIAMDVWLYDRKANPILNNTGHKGWYQESKKLAAYLTSQGMEWGERINDTVHFEYHPSWPGLAGGKRLKGTHSWAEGLASTAGDASETSVDWMPYFWWAAGAGGAAPVMESQGEGGR